jgi:hypothetical protein
MTEIEDRSGAASPELERIPSGAAPIYHENGAISREAFYRHRDGS